MSESEVVKIIIKPSKGWLSLNLRELWEYHELAFFLAWRDVSVRYKQTVLGILWALIQPFFMMIVFSIFLGKMAKVPSDGLPYPIFAYTALLPWQYFASVLSESSNSLVLNQNLIKRVYFPRFILPISNILAPAIDFSIAFVLLLFMMLYYGIYPTANIIYLPVFLFLSIITSLGVSFWLSALNIQYRDVRYAIPFLVQLWMFSSPVVYPASVIPEKWLWLYSLNPMTGVLEGFRWAILGAGTVEWTSTGLSIFVALFIFVSGAYFFRRMEKTFADMV
ncbi:MAG: ABC transporter permease [Streptococcus sp.]|nr:ABC transporter permease [Streptococcus sp.]